jgi:predicted ribosome quality control (RQC) complex YloA/Tae2 family protein
MPLDAICLSAVIWELKNTLIGGKIDKIYQPNGDEAVLAIRGYRENVKLLLSANPNQPRPQLTRLNRENPDSPPMFCMLLRKHLLGGKILDISQPPMERVCSFLLETTDELGDRVERRLVLECMGRRANLILLDAEGRIIDCLRRVAGDLAAGTRQVLPGMYYRLPPQQDKKNPLTCGEEELRAVFNSAPEERDGDQVVLDSFLGISPMIARELSFRAGNHRDDLFQQVQKLIRDVEGNSFTPCLLMRDGKPADFSFLPILQYGPTSEIRRYESFSELLDDFYAAREQSERAKQRGQDLLKSVTNAKDRTARKIANQKTELAATGQRERLRELGDIITSNLYQMEKGMRVLRAMDFYDPEGTEVEITLDPLKTPQQNAAKYYKDYNKAKTAQEMLTLQIEKGERELEYLSGVLENIPLAEGDRDLQEIRQELMETGYLKVTKKTGKKEKKQVSKPMEFRSSCGLRISVGKNNTQNDQLTTKSAFKSDIWLHTQKIHGSHVILWTEGKEPDVRSLEEAAILAAYFSQARESSKVPVDFTPVKFVKKPAGARPGMVIYTTYQTAYVTPDEELIKRLRVK